MKQEIKFPKPPKNVKCDCGHTIKDHQGGKGGWCHSKGHPNEGQCGCTWFHPNVKWIQATRKKIGMPPCKI